MASKCQVMDVRQGALSGKVFLSVNFLMFVVEDRSNPEHDIYEKYPWKEVAGWGLGVKELMPTFPFYRVNPTFVIGMANAVRFFTEGRKKNGLHYVHNITALSPTLFMDFVGALDSVFRFHHNMPTKGFQTPPQKEISVEALPAAITPPTQPIGSSPCLPNPMNVTMMGMQAPSMSPLLTAPGPHTLLMEKMMTTVREDPELMTQMVIKLMKDSPGFANQLNFALTAETQKQAMGWNPMMMTMASNPMMAMQMRAMMMQQHNLATTTSPTALSTPMSSQQVPGPVTTSAPMTTAPSAPPAAVENSPPPMAAASSAPPAAVENSPPPMNPVQSPLNTTSCKGFETLNRTAKYNLSLDNDNF